MGIKRYTIYIMKEIYYIKCKHCIELHCAALYVSENFICLCVRVCVCVVGSVESWLAMEVLDSDD